jgi:hypothetical protein
MRATGKVKILRFVCTTVPGKSSWGDAHCPGRIPLTLLRRCPHHRNHIPEPPLRMSQFVSASQPFSSLPPQAPP